MKKEGMSTEDKDKIFRKAARFFREREERHKQFVEKFGHIRIPQLLEVWGKSMFVVGNTFYRQTRTGDNTFIHAVHDYALHFFGEEYLRKQETLEMKRRHPALQWMYTYVEQTQSKEQKQTGAGAAWLRFAYDLYTIADNAVLEEKMKERLLKFKYFQGARHELWTAALFIAANFDIKFVDEADSSQKHPEFIAVDKVSGVSIAVEAKSRQRRGVLGFNEGTNKPLGEEVKIRNLVSRAYKKEAGIPLCVVIDTNLPPQSKNWNLEYWFDELKQTMDTLTVNPCPANLILFRNDPSHHLVNEKIGDPSDCLWIKEFVPTTPKNACEQLPMFCERLLKAHRQRLHPPVEIPDI